MLVKRMTPTTKHLVIMMTSLLIAYDDDSLIKMTMMTTPPPPPMLLLLLLLLLSYCNSIRRCDHSNRPTHRISSCLIYRNFHRYTTNGLVDMLKCKFIRFSKATKRPRPCSFFSEFDRVRPFTTLIAILSGSHHVLGHHCGPCKPNI